MMKLDARRTAALVQAVRTGEHLNAVAARFGVTAETARVHCHKAGITPRVLKGIREAKRKAA
jgi:hypothetical protein